jgi:acetyl esterase/lipase
MISSALPRPPFDSELAKALAGLGPLTFTGVEPGDIQAKLRDIPFASPINELLSERGITTSELELPGWRDASMPATLLRASQAKPASPAFYFLHGGGMVSGDRMSGIAQCVDWLTDHKGVALTIDYRLAPEHPYPYQLEDAYSGLVWLAENATALGVDPSKIIIAGASAGGGLAAGLALLCRDRGGPSIAGQVLIYPMLDDRDNTVSTAQFEGAGVWDRTSNRTAWQAYLGELDQTCDVPGYAAAARATDLSGLPPTYLDCGSAETFRDEITAYACALWEAGVHAELHVWAGGFHGFDTSVPDAAVSRAMIWARADWLARLLR